MKRSLRSWLWSVPLEQEVDEELRLHVDLRARELEARGVDPRVAREMALARLGNVGQLRRTCVDLGRKRSREMRITQWIDELTSDIRFALRQLRRSPAFTAVAVLTLALGVGVNSAIFALADATLLRALPYPEADRLMFLQETRRNGFPTSASQLDLADWRERNRTFDGISGVLQNGAAMPGNDGIAERVPTQIVNTSFFDIFGVTPILGRTFLPSDETPSLDAIVLSEAFWRTRFAADPGILGHRLTLDGRPFTVIGVVPGDFQFRLPALDGIVRADPAAVWMLLARVARNPSARFAHFVPVVGRLKAGQTIEAARADMKAVAETIGAEAPESHLGFGIRVQPLRETLIGTEVRTTSLLLLGVVAFVLLLCCANVASLLLARTAGRSRELAVRSALGAGRRRIVTQLLTESLVVAAFGTVAGAAIGAAILEAAPSFVPTGLLPSVVTLEFDGRVAMFCAATALAVGIVFGLAPARRGTGLSLVHALGVDGRGTTIRGASFQRMVVGAEIAAATLLLCGAGLLLRTFVNLASIEGGHRSSELLTTVISLPQGANVSGPGATAESMRRYYEAVEQEVARAPGVRRAAWGSSLPLDGMWYGNTFQIAGDVPTPETGREPAAYEIVTPAYFATLGVDILQGRGFTDQDRDGANLVAIVNEAFVQRYLAGRSPIGMRVEVPLMSLAPAPPPFPAREIVGVARQIKLSPSEPRPMPRIYVPLDQNPWWTASLLVQPASGTATSLMPAVRAAVARVNRDVPLTRVRTMRQVSNEATSRWRFRAVLVGAFAAVALGLAMVGVFGVLAYTVQQRVREFGVRIALGASVSDVVRLVVSSSAWVTVIGAAIGLAAAAMLSRYIATLLFGVQPLDPLTFGVALAVLLVTAAIATAVPTLRATRVDPVVTFRND
jgi:putative ABC transport system permease protein